MPRPKTVEQLKRLCGGCRNDRYNMGRGYTERPGTDAPVMVDACWHLEPANALYCQGAKKWVMSCHSSTYQRWLIEWARTGKKPMWKYW